MPLFGNNDLNNGIFVSLILHLLNNSLSLHQLDNLASMEKDNTTPQDTKSCRLADYLDSSHITLELLDVVKEVFVRNNRFSAVLISVDDESVVNLSDNINRSAKGIDSNTVVDILSYIPWKNKIVSSFAFDYDRRRFLRSTELSTLRRKVRDHQRYSFVAHKLEDEDQDCVLKYDFIAIDHEAKFILATQQEITHSLEHDVLTGGLNRTGLLKELQVKFESVSNPDQYTLIYFNIQNFRMINELHGDEIGDKVLQFMYTSIVYSDLQPISYARIDSDNFVCLVDNKNYDTATINRLCHLEYIEDSTVIPFRSICGIYHIPDKNEAPINACNRAKLATSYVKDTYLQPWVEFNPSMQKVYFSDTEILKQLDEAIANKEFVPFFQPIVNAQTGRIEMAEALVRWKSPAKGMIPPGVFIPVLERHGGLSRIDAIMEEHVFEMQKKRYREGLPIVPVDINLSWVDFADNQLLDQLYAHIKDEALPTDMMRYEITETALAEIAENRYDVLDFFKIQHVKLLIDDFGQAYSFGTMKDVDFTIIKIDKSMIDQIGSSRKVNLLIETMISMFHKMHAKVVAEGVETETQVEYLKQVGCDYIQGFHFFRPMDEQAFSELLDHNEEAHAAVLTENKAKVVKAVETDIPSAKKISSSRLKKKVSNMWLLLSWLKLSDFKSTFLIVATCGLLAALIYFSTYQLVYNLVTESCDEITERDIDKIKLYVDLELSSAQEALQAFSTTVFQNGLDIPKSEEEIYVQMERFLANTPFLSGIVAGFEDSVFPEYEDKFGFGPLVRNQGDSLVRYQVGEIRDFRHTKEWYSEAFAQKKARWSSPFFSEEGDIIIDYCIPLMNEQQDVVGVVACDLSISHLRQVTEDIKPYASSSVMIMQKDLTFVIHPEKGYPMHKTLPVFLKERNIPVLDTLLLNSLRDGKKGKTIYGGDVIANTFIYYDVIEKGDYRLLIESNSQDVYKSLNEVSTTMKLIGTGGLLFLIIVLAVMIYENKKRERKEVEHHMEILRHSAEIDGLTGIFNRSTGEKMISELMHEGTPGILAILDCDKFKLVNDIYGHTTGDKLLKLLAETIKNSFAGDIVLRLGGDEFAVFCSEQTVAQFELKVQNFFLDVKDLHVQGMGDYTPSVSMGAAVYHGEEGLEFDRLYTMADRLLYESKRTEGCALTITEH